MIPLLIKHRLQSRMCNMYIKVALWCEKKRWGLKKLVWSWRKVLNSRVLKACYTKTDKNASLSGFISFHSLLSLTGVRQEISMEAFQLLRGFSLSHQLSDINAHSLFILFLGINTRLRRINQTENKGGEKNVGTKLHLISNGGVWFEGLRLEYIHQPTYWRILGRSTEILESQSSIENKTKSVGKKVYGI